MTGLFIDVSEYAADPIEWDVERAIRYLEVAEEYDYYESSLNR